MTALIFTFWIHNAIFGFLTLAPMLNPAFDNTTVNRLNIISLVLVWIAGALVWGLGAITAGLRRGRV